MISCECVAHTANMIHPVLKLNKAQVVEPFKMQNEVMRKSKVEENGIV